MPHPNDARNDTLQDLVNTLQAMQSSCEDEAIKLRRRVQWLDARRREFFSILSQSGSDPDIVRKLDETEKQIEEIHGVLGRIEGELKQSQMEFRQKILKVRDEEMSRIQAERERIRQRREKIRNLLPQAINRVERLQEEDNSITQEDAELQRRLRELGALDQFTSETV